MKELLTLTGDQIDQLGCLDTPAEAEVTILHGAGPNGPGLYARDPGGKLWALFASVGEAP